MPDSVEGGGERFDPDAVDAREAERFRALVYARADAYRRDLPWRVPSQTDRPWAVFVSEIMLQQTQATRVVPRFSAWMARFPDPGSLAGAPTAEVLALWSGLGYNRRALAMQRAAAEMVRLHGGSVPRDEKDLLALPGVGTYTARAVRAFAFGIPGAFLETNIRTVLIRHFFPAGTGFSGTGIERAALASAAAAKAVGTGNDPAAVRTAATANAADAKSADSKIADADLEKVAAAVVDLADPARWYNAMMDYGAELKRQGSNHSRLSAAYRPQSSFRDSRRRIRGAILKAALRPGGTTLEAVAASLPFSAERVDEAARMLVAEGFLEYRGARLLPAGAGMDTSPYGGSSADPDVSADPDAMPGSDGPIFPRRKSP